MPRQLSEPIVIDITGYFIAWGEDHPVMVHVRDGGDDVYLMIFSTEEKFLEMIRTTGVACDSVKRIEDSMEFINSIPLYHPNGGKIRIAVDPYLTATRRSRYTEIIRAWDE